jgi:hypothetical protein
MSWFRLEADLFAVSPNAGMGSSGEGLSSRASGFRIGLDEPATVWLFKEFTLGSWPEWERVIRDTVYDGLLMFLFLWILIRRRDEESGRQNLLMFIAALYMGIIYGLNATFHSRMWHWPLSMVSAFILVSYLGVALTLHREVAANWRRDWRVWSPRLKRLRLWNLRP